MAGLLLEGHAVVPQRLLAQASPVLLARLFQGILPHPATPEVPSGSLSFIFFVLSLLSFVPSGAPTRGCACAQSALWCQVSMGPGCITPRDTACWFHTPRYKGSSRAPGAGGALVAWCKPACMTALSLLYACPGQTQAGGSLLLPKAMQLLVHDCRMNSRPTLSGSV